MTYRKLILADRIRSGAHALPRYRLTIQEGLFWRKTRVFVTYCEDSGGLHRKVKRSSSWFEVHSRDLGIALVSEVEDPLLQATLTAFLLDAKINGDVR